jgi:hypothetical protein
MRAFSKVALHMTTYFLHIKGGDMFKRLPVVLTIVFGLLLISAGCTSVRLRKNTIAQANTLSDIYEQQVLDNLAMFIYDYNSLPHFAFPATGANSLADTVAAKGILGWAKAGFNSASAELDGTRMATENWQLTAVVDPRILELMRCAYQIEVAPCLLGVKESTECPNCKKRFKVYYTGSPKGEFPQKDSAEDKGEVTSECLNPGKCCWFQVYCEKCLPKHHECCHIGHYCGVYVSVPRGAGQEELTKLTLVILDYAFNKPASPPAEPTKEVTLIIDNQGNVTSRTIKAIQKLSADDSKIVKPYEPGVQKSFLDEKEKVPGANGLPEREPRYQPTSILPLRQELQAFGP